MTFNNANGKIMESGPGGWVANPANVIIVSGAPSTAATEYLMGTIAIRPGVAAYICVNNTGINGTVTWDQLGLATGTVGELSSDSGNALPAAGIITVAGGTGVTTSATGSTLTVNAVGGGLKTTVSASTPTALAPNTRLVTNTGGLYTATMPATAAVGDIFEVMGNGAGGWLVQANTGQTINSSGGSTTSAGSLASTNRYDTVRFVCVVANTTFTVESINGVLTNA